MINTPHSHDEDIRMVQGCIRQDKKYQEKFYKKYSPQVFAVALRYCKNRPEAEQLLHDVFLEILDTLGQWKQEESINQWMKNIVIRRVIKTMKKKNISTNTADTLPDEVLDIQHIEDLTTEKIFQILQSLPDEERIIFNLRIIDAYTYKEIAKLLGGDEWYVEAQYTHTREHIGKLCKEQKFFSE